MTTVRQHALPRDFLSPGVMHVLAAIRAAGGRPMLTGGCVRDAVLGVTSDDIDIEVYGISDPDRLAAALTRTGNVTEAGREFGVFKLRAGTTSIDVTLPRRESKYGAGHRGFTVITDSALGFAEAAARRDFTVNALMADPETGEITDCHGGLADLEAGILRHTSAAFPEDPLRVLRGARFTARFGFQMAPATTALCRSIAGRYTELSTERVWGEIRKIGFQGTDITGALRVLADTGWEQHFPQIAALHGVRQDPVHHPEGDVHVHAGLAADQAARLADRAGLTGDDRLVIIIAALAHDFGKAVSTQRGGAGWQVLRTVTRNRWFRITSHGHAVAGVAPARAFLETAGCPWAVTSRVLPLVREHMSCITPPTKAAVRRLARRLTPVTMTELALVVGADRGGRGNPDAPNPAAAWLELAQGLTIAERPLKGLLTGHHLIAAGMTPGPAFGPLLADALSAQDAGEFSDEPGAVRWLTGRLQSAGTLLG